MAEEPRFRNLETDPVRVCASRELLRTAFPSPIYELEVLRDHDYNHFSLDVAKIVRKGQVKYEGPLEMRTPNYTIDLWFGVHRNYPPLVAGEINGYQNGARILPISFVYNFENKKSVEEFKALGSKELLAMSVKKANEGLVNAVQLMLEADSQLSTFCNMYKSAVENLDLLCAGITEKAVPVSEPKRR